MPTKSLTAKDDLSCNGCDYQTLPADSGFCYMFNKKPEPICCQHTREGKTGKKYTPLTTALLIGTLFAKK